MPVSEQKPPATQIVQLRQLGSQDYTQVWQAMQRFTQQRNDGTLDEIWLLEHPPVFTLGLNGKQHHILNAGDIPVVPSDRGGQVTYHGPGQLVAYLLLDLKRHNLNVRSIVSLIEKSIIALLGEYGIPAQNRKDAPGVYVNGAKIAALGLRIKQGCCYHGLSLNVDMDLEPFSRINPCGYPDMAVTQLTHFGVNENMPRVAHALLTHISTQLGYHLVTAETNEDLFIHD